MKAIITIGVPGSGKTTWAKKNKTSEVILEADNIRMGLQGTDDRHLAFVPDDEPLVWELFYANLDIVLKSQRDIIISNTNTNWKILKRLKSRLEIAGYEVEFVVLDTPIEICKSRVAPSMHPIIDLFNKQMSTTVAKLLTENYQVTFVSVTK